VLLVAHRTPASPEACRRLAEAGANVFEVDVQVDSGDHIVVSHYQPLGRFARLQRDNWRLRWYSAAGRDPRLRDIDALVPEHCRVLLDLKERAPAGRARLVAAIADQLPDRARFVVSSPRPDDLAALRHAGFGTWRSVGDAGQLASVLAGPALDDDAITIRHTLLDSSVLRQLRERAPAVICWTVNARRRAMALRELGVAGVTTDSRPVLRALAASAR
jgi:glycerophosphoryl diester phosphodiesterase